ncbi:epithelial sodium channel subunit beta-like [Glandiceps talaboti]
MMTENVENVRQVESNRKAFRKLFRELLNNTSAHGIPHAARSTTSTRRFAWSLLFVVAVGCFIGQFSVLITRYSTFPVSVNVDVKVGSYLPFPAVTVCNENAIRKSKLDDNEYIKNIFMPSPPLQAPPREQNITDNQNDRNDSSTDDSNIHSSLTSQSTPANNTDDVGRLDTTTVSTGQERKKRSNIRRRRETSNESLEGPPIGQPSPDGNNGPPAGHTQIAELTEIISSLDEDVRIELGHQAESFIVNCSWQGNSCSSDNFTVFSDSMYGNCFTFNGLGSDYTYTTSFPGPLYGLSLQLFIEQHEYLPDYEPSSKAGVRITIHDQNKMPFPQDNAYTIAPGYATSIGVRRVEVQRQPDPYSDCVQLTDSAYENIYMQTYGVGYSVQTCMKSCYQYHVIDRCGCADPYYPYDNKLFSSCDSKNTTQMYCKALVEYNYTIQTEDISCDCPQACTDISFTSELSSASWPSKSSLTSILNQLSTSSPSLAQLILEDTQNDTGAVSDNLLRLDIYYQELNYELLVYEPSYVWTDLGSDFGGLIGLWIGVSVLTCFEFLEFVFDLVRLAIARGCRSKRPSTKGPEVSKRQPERSDWNGDVFFLDRRQGFPTSDSTSPSYAYDRNNGARNDANPSTSGIRNSREHTNLGREGNPYKSQSPRMDSGYQSSFLQNQPYNLY